MTKLTVAPEIFQAFPDTIIGVVVFQDIINKGEKAELLTALRSEEDQTAARFAGIAVSDHPQILPWREAYRKFGAKPKDYPSSIENLVRRVIKGHHLPHINLLVDLYNAVSLKHVIPTGGEDLDKIQGDISLTFASESETPIKLLGEPEARAPKKGEVIYKDELGAICRRWNWKEADRTKFTEDTKNGILILEGLPPVDRALIQQAMDELAVLVRTHCGGNVRTEILSASRPEIELSGS